MTTQNSNKQKDPIEKLKTKANSLIRTLNSIENNLGIKPIFGDYGTIKIHKENSPLRPVLSQVPTANHLAKVIRLSPRIYLANKPWTTFIL